MRGIYSAAWPAPMLPGELSCSCILERCGITQKKGFARLGADAGFDSMNDENYASQVGGLLSVAENLGHLPKTVLYCLNPTDTPMLACLAGCFQEMG